MTSKLHVGVIMDGNGRWARRRGLPRTRGHRAGARAVRAVIEAAVEFEIGTLTLYAFSADNWQRPVGEIGALMALLKRYLHGEVSRCLANDVQVTIIGRRDRLPPSVVVAIETIESLTAHCNGLRLRLAIDYSSRYALAQAARQAKQLDVSGIDASLGGRAVSAVDLLIRSGGERRLSDFMLWECAYAELHFVATPWPDFGRDDLEAALAEFCARERRYGRLTARGAR